MTYRNILLIEDDPDDQEIFITVLESISDTVKCIAIGDAELALDKLKNKEITPEIIFIDLNMPMMNGIQFLTEVKQQEVLMEIPVIVLTTASDPGIIKKVKYLGAYDYIIKPSKYGELRKALVSILV
jgi:CheY-like chemotaxis protein